MFILIKLAVWLLPLFFMDEVTLEPMASYGDNKLWVLCHASLSRRRDAYKSLGVRTLLIWHFWTYPFKHQICFKIVRKRTHAPSWGFLSFSIKKLSNPYHMNHKWSCQLLFFILTSQNHPAVQLWSEWQVLYSNQKVSIRHIVSFGVKRLFSSFFCFL